MWRTTTCNASPGGQGSHVTHDSVWLLMLRRFQNKIRHCLVLFVAVKKSECGYPMGRPYKVRSLVSNSIYTYQKGQKLPSQCQPSCFYSVPHEESRKMFFFYCTFCFISPKPTVLWTCTMHHHDPLSSLIPKSSMASCHNNNV